MLSGGSAVLSQVPREALLLALMLVVYNNAVTVGSWALGQLTKGSWSLLSPFLNIFTAIGLLWWAVSKSSFTPQELGLSQHNLMKKAMVGVGLGIVMAAPSLLFFAFPMVVPGRVRWWVGESMAPQEWLFRVFIVGLFSISFFEELAFRGVLDAQLRRFMPKKEAVLLGSVAFLFWHLAIHYFTYFQTNLPSTGLWLTALALSGGLVVYFVAGVIFSLMRHLSDSLITPIMAHWVVNSVMVSSFFLRSLG